MNHEEKFAKEMADAMRVEMETNPLLKTSGVALDPAILFGDHSPSPKTRISVVNLIGLQHLNEQRYFLNQLAMLLFSWIKKNPNPPGRRLRGLLVIDEAKDFVPSQKASVCKESLMRLTAQARKYHLGVVFATQNSRDIDNKIIGNCSTHYYGRANSPVSIDVIREQMRLKGGSGDDVPKLPRGNFYVFNADANMKSPVKSPNPTKSLEPSCQSMY